MIIAGSKIYECCEDCGKLVQLNKPIFGGIHICLLPEEREAKQLLRSGLITYNECILRLQRAAEKRGRK